MASKNTQNQPGKVFILGIEGEEIFYLASNHEIVSRLKTASARVARYPDTSKTAGAKTKPHLGSAGLGP
jgi:hypothetical protein